jgi:hypothetical protein
MQFPQQNSLWYDSLVRQLTSITAVFLEPMLVVTSVRPFLCHYIILTHGSVNFWGEKKKRPALEVLVTCGVSRDGGEA